MSTPYAELVALAEREWSLVCEGTWEQLPALIEERRRLMAAAPSIAPPEAAADLQRLVELQSLVLAALTAGRVTAAREIARLRTGHGAVRGYAATALASAR